MRVKLSCKLTSTDNKIGYNYNRALSSLIYELLGQYDPSYAKSLHDSNNIKGFTFSPLNFQTAQYRQKITISANRFSFVVSTSDEVLLNALLNTNQRELVLNTVEGSIHFIIDKVEVAKPVVTTKTFVLGSPLVINFKGEKRIEYLAPDDEKYKELLFKNLIRKAGKQFTDYNIDSFKFEVLTAKPKEKLINKIKGYIYDFMIDCPEELIMAGVVNGFGVKNSQGFGFVK